MSVADFERKHSGERVFLIGNGPSLRETPLETVDDEATIAMNNVDRIYADTDWRPTYYLNVQGMEPVDDPSRYWIDKHVRVPMRTASLNIPTFLSKSRQNLLPDRNNIVYLDKHKLKMDRNVMLSRVLEGRSIDEFWQRDLTNPVYRKHTSMYVAAQLAAYMGFAEMYFVGCDLFPEFKPFSQQLFEGGSDPQEYRLAPHPPQRKGKLDFILRDGRPVRSATNGVLDRCLRNKLLMKNAYRALDSLGLLRDSQFTSGSRESHFDDDYHTHVQDEADFVPYGINEKLIVVHKIIKGVGERVGFDTYNATLGGQLEVHPRVNLDDVLGA